MRPVTIRSFALGVLVSLASASYASHIVLAQDVRIPSERQLERMERQDIITPPLSTGPAETGSLESQDQRMDRRAREVDERVMRGICSACE